MEQKIDLTNIKLLIDGRGLSAEEVHVLESSVEIEDIGLRSQLLGYYNKTKFFDQFNADKFAEHALWFIENHPEHIVTSQTANINPDVSGWKSYLRGKELWLDHIRESPDDLMILNNAIEYFRWNDSKLAEQLCLKAMALDSSDSHFADTLASLHCPSEDGEAYEKLESELTGNRTVFQFSTLAKGALKAGKLEKALNYAQQVLQSKEESDDTIDKFEAYLVLGEVALQMNDLEEAKTYLQKAGRTPYSASIDIFGPNMELAKQLLNLGEVDAVLNFLEALGGTYSKPYYSAWIQALNDGWYPNFFIYEFLLVLYRRLPDKNAYDSKKTRIEG